MGPAFLSSLGENLYLTLGITLGGLILYQIVFFFFKRSAKEGSVARLLQDHVYYPGLFLVLFVTLLIDLPFIEDYIGKKFYLALRHTFIICAIAITGWLLMRAITVVREITLHHYLSRAPIDYTVRKAKTKFQLIQRVLNFLIILTTIAVILMTFKSIRQVGSTLLASAGVVGLVLGFAAQKSLGTLFAGIQIAISQPIRLDDVVVVEGEFGTIGEITLTYVVVNTWDGRRLVVPINYFIEKSFENWTRVSPEVIGKVRINADYTLPIDVIREQLYKWLEESELWDKRTRNLIVSDANDRTIQIRATMSARNSDDAFDLECLVREKLITFIQANYPNCLPHARSVVMQSQPPKENAT